ncbi:MAG: hypothetical protein ACXWVT_06380 [Burkholderiaceae bacterium]
MHRFVAAVCLAIVPVVAAATIYKVQMPDGTILFTDSPPANGKILEERESKSTARPPVKAPTPGTGSAGGSDRPAIPVLPSPAPRSGSGPGLPPGMAPQNIDAANAEVTAAERELAVLRRKLEVGREPLPGERLGTAKGGSRLSPEYESRIGGLEREVGAAEERVKRAYEARNSLK